MCQMYRVGYTNAEIIGYALRRCDWNRAGNNLYDDCTRILRKIIGQRPERRISDASQQRAAILAGEHTDQGVTKKSKRPRDRPRGGIAAHLLAYFTQDGEHVTFDDMNSMLAAQLHTTQRTIMRGLDALQQAG